MKRLIPLLLIVMPFTSAQAGEPSAMFGQELAQVSDPNAINFDLYSSAPNNSTLRVGLDTGEIIVDHAGPASQSLSYKWFLNKEFALYGGLGVNAGNADQMIVGGAYTLNKESIRFNINPVINVGGGATQMDLYLGAFMKFNGIKDKKMLLGAQLHSDLSAATNDVTLGLRWLARDNITIDLALFNANQLEFPGLISVNMSF